MVTFEKEFSIERPLQEVFDYVSDPANDPQWRDAELAEWTSEAPYGVGSTQRSVGKILGRKIESSTEVTEWDPPKHFAFKSIGGPLPFEFRVSLEGVGEGTKLVVEGQAEAGGFFKLAEGLVARQFEKQLDNDFSSLKKVLES
jgi:carbon monoxide dehydrogenase subunit G